MSRHQVRVYPLPGWIDVERLLGPGAWESSRSPARVRSASAVLDEEAAADLAARLRGVGLGGFSIAVEVEPPLSRAAVRQARQDDARRRRETTPATDIVGVRMDEEARVSWTPAVLARRMAAAAAGWRVVDAGCGAGGNTIAFAEAGCTVTAIERDSARLAMARENVARAGVGDRVTFVHGDAVERAPSLVADLLFVDPPWGVDWNRQRVGARSLPPLLDLLALAGSFPHVWCKLPPSIAPDSLPGQWDLEGVFGEAPGDRRRIKFVWARWPPDSAISDSS